MATTELSFTATYSFATHRLTGALGGNNDEVVWSCDIDPEGEVFMECESFVSHKEVPCGRESYWKIDRHLDFADGFGFLDQEYATEIFMGLED